ncbi:MAG: hypothetical protein PHQ40_02210 [Anaerolineaceae bacterium]|nr:hypothetical protein [Anaerolineaceae bacterium]
MADREAQVILHVSDRDIGSLVLQAILQQQEERPDPAVAQGGDIHLGDFFLDGVPALNQQLPGGANGSLQFCGRGSLASGQSEGFRCSCWVVEGDLLHSLDELVGQESAGKGDVGRGHRRSRS